MSIADRLKSKPKYALLRCRITKDCITFKLVRKIRIVEKFSNTRVIEYEKRFFRLWISETKRILSDDKSLIELNSRLLFISMIRKMKQYETDRYFKEYTIPIVVYNKIIKDMKNG